VVLVVAIIRASLSLRTVLKLFLSCRILTALVVISRAEQIFGGTDFREIRKKQEKEKNKNVPENLKGIAHLWYDIQSLEDKKRERKARIIQVKGKGSGYGCAYVPVLAANNYSYGGETSVFDREQKQSKKANFEVKKKSKTATFVNESHCLMCGDGGALVCCSRCPASVHLSCVGLTHPNEFMSCNHHRCSLCSKNRGDAGGILFPCHACPNSFCEECLPKKGVTFLEKVDRFERLGFDSTKHVVYINCSPMCEKYAKEELDYVPVKKDDSKGVCPEEMDLSQHFGASFDLNEAAAAVEAVKDSTSGRGKRTRTVKNYREPTRSPEAVNNKNKNNSQQQQQESLSFEDDRSTYVISTSSDSSSEYAPPPRTPTTASAGNDIDHAIELD